MANDEMWGAPDIVPTIIYSDLPRAVEWFQRVFGFRERASRRHDGAQGRGGDERQPSPPVRKLDLGVRAPGRDGVDDGVPADPPRE